MLSVDSVVKVSTSILSGILGAWIYEKTGAKSVLVLLAFVCYISIVAYVSHQVRHGSKDAQ